MAPDTSVTIVGSLVSAVLISISFEVVAWRVFSNLKANLQPSPADYVARL
jgi:hypothetical protein